MSSPRAIDLRSWETGFLVVTAGVVLISSFAPGGPGLLSPSTPSRAFSDHSIFLTTSSLSADFTAMNVNASCYPDAMTVTLVANASGGSPPYHDAWYFGQHTSWEFGPTVVHTFPGYGPFNATLYVQDSKGTNISVTRVISTTPPSCAVQASVPWSFLTLAILGTAASMGILTAVAVASFRRHQPPSAR